MSDPKAVDPGVELVKIKNTTRSTVCFRVPGQSIHLLPGQTADVPSSYLDTVELEILRRQGTVTALKPPAKQDARAPEKHPATGGSAEPQGSVTDGSKQS